jgi:hypothetical protein
MAKLKGGTRIYGNVKIDGGILDTSSSIGIGGSVLISTGVGIAWTGSAGLQGMQGAQGLQGTQGNQGFQGTQGNQGLQGLQGRQGLQGDQGVQGLQGLQGRQGLQGLQGVGSQGLQGVQGGGTQGNQGLQGAQGLQGIQGGGTQGNQGLQGLQGRQGLQGLQGGGTQGSQGLQGAQGLQGIQGGGTQGNQGLQGAQGNQGLQGVQGLSNQGVQGLQGLQGRQGLQGIQGGPDSYWLKTLSGVSTVSNVGVGTTNPAYPLTVTTSTATATTGLSNVIGDFTANTNSYSQINTRNASTGANASSDIIATADTGTDTTNYIDLGINNSLYSVGTWTINGALDGYLYTSDTNLSIGAASATKYVSIFAGGTLAANEVVRVNSTGVGIGNVSPSHTLHVQGNARITGAFRDSTNSPGTSGQVLQSTVTGTQWATASASSGGGGSGKFDTTIDNVLYVQPTGTLDIVGVGTTTTQITTLPASSPEYIIHSMHVTNISNGDAEITAGFVMNARKVPAAISVSVGSSGGAGIHTFTVGSASSITVGMAVTGTGNIGETTGIGSTAGFQYNTYVTSVDGNNITLSKPMSGRATGVLQFSPVSLISSRLPVPVGSAVELLKQPMVLNALDSIVLQSTGAGSGIGSTSTNAITQAANSNILTVTAGAAITNFLASGMLIGPTGSNTGIQTNTFVGVGYIPGALSVPMTKPATVSLASTSLSFTEVVTPQDGALQVTVVYQSSTDTSYQNGTGTVVGIVTLASQATSPVLGITSTVPLCYYGTGNTYPSIIQSIRVSNISDGTIYPGGDYPVSVGIGNSDTIFSWLAYNMVIPRNSSIELCEAPKRIGIGQSIFAFSNTPNAIEIQVAGKQKI